MKIARTLLIAAAVAFCVVALAGFAIGRIDLERYREVIDARLTSAIGLDVAIAGELHAELLPRPHLEVGGVSVANLPGRSATPLLQIGSLDLTLDLLQLLRGRVRIHRLGLEDVEIHVETDADGKLRHEHHLDEVTDEASSGPIDLEIRSLEIEKAEVHFANLGNGRVTTFSVERLELEDTGWGDPLLLTAEGSAEGARFDLTATGGSLPLLLRGGAPFPLALSGTLFGASVEITGSVRDMSGFDGYDLLVTASIPNLVGLLPDADAAFEGLGPIRLAGRIDDREGAIRVRDLDAGIPKGGVLHGTARGSIDDVYALSGVQLVFELEVDELASLAPAVGRPLPDAAAATISATLADKDGSLGLTGSLNASAKDGSWTLVVEGEHDDLLENDEIDVALRLEARDVAAISEAVGADVSLPPMGPVAATAQLRDQQGTLSLADIDLELGKAGDVWAKTTGTIGDLRAMKRVDLHVEFQAPRTRDLLAGFGLEIPSGGSLEAGAHLTDGNGTLGLEKVAVRNAHPGFIDVEISGSLDDLRARNGFDFDARVSAKDLSVIGQLLGEELPAIGPVSYSGRIRGSKESARSTGSLAIANTRIDGDLSGAWPERGRPRIGAKLRSKLVRLGDVGFYAWIDRELAEPKRPDADALSDALDELRRLDLDLSVTADRVTGRGGLDLASFGAQIQLDSGRLQLRNAHANYSTGSLEVSLDADASSPHPRVDFRAAMRGVDLTHLASQFDSDSKQAGRADLSVQLRSGGKSLAELTRRLDGHLKARIRDGNIASRYAELFIHELSIVSMPGLLHRRKPRVTCMLMDFSLDSGTATVQKLSVDTESVEVVGAGRIDLVNDSYHLRLTPTSRDPSLLSITATVDVTGPLAKPVFHPIPQSIPISATRSLIMNSTRPVRELLGAITPKSLHPARKDCPSPFGTAATPTAVVP